MGALFAPNVTLARKSFWTHLMELLSDVGHMEARLDLFGHSAGLGAR
jgi:hypothetical protein